MKGQLTQFLGRIEFRYVPAIKDRAFFKHLYKELQTRLVDRELSEIKNESNKLQEIIKKETANLFEEFRKSTGLEASFSLLEEDLVNFEKSVEVETLGNVFLPYRGDGVQARFIPDVLNEISKDSKKKKYILWGFEEPENSYELKNIRKLKDNFINEYSINKQIFITTHSREFLAIDESDIEKKNGQSFSVYRVYKKADNSSQVAYYDEKKGFSKQQIQQSFWGQENETEEKKTVLEELFRDLGIIDESKKIVELEKLLEKNSNSSSELQRLIEDLKKPIVFVEDKNVNLYKISWLKLNEFNNLDNNNFNLIFDKKCGFKILPSGGKMELFKKLDMVHTEEFSNKKIIGVFDFDDAFDDFKGLKKERWKEYEGATNSCLLRKRKDVDNMFALMIPVPYERGNYASLTSRKNYLIVEHLLPDKALISKGHFKKEEEDVGAGGKVIKLHEKDKIWESSFAFNKDDFKNFEPLFEKIRLLLK